MYIFHVPCHYIHLSHHALPIPLPSNCQVTHTTSLILTVDVIPLDLMILQPVQKTEEQCYKTLKYLKYL